MMGNFTYFLSAADLYKLQRRHLSELWLKQLLSGQESVMQLQ